jgi:hypothetical protein
MTNKIDKGGRRVGIKKKTIGFKVPEVVHVEVREEARPIIEEIVKRKMKKVKV